MSDLSRRAVVTTGAVGGLVLGAARAVGADRRPSAATAPLRADPFTLGVASGDPGPGGFVLWTRLAPRPLAADGFGGMPSATYSVEWEVATDRYFRDVVRRGVRDAGPVSAHAVHVEVAGLEPGREYHYRFRTDRFVSRVGHTRTAPSYAGGLAAGAELTVAMVSCSNYPAGYFTAYRRLAQERPDLVVHLGDYIYEYGHNVTSPVGRPHRGERATTLADYRQRHAQYKTDRDLQAAHAAAPWLVVWDDHEVANNYAGLQPTDPADAATFAQRRQAAYRAYYENMPLRAAAAPTDGQMRLHRRVRWGQLATFHLLDTRQYRDVQACGGGFQDCPAADDPNRTMLGAAQEQWLDDGLHATQTARWDLLAQQVFFGRRDRDTTAAHEFSLDSWDGYPAARRRVVDSVVGSGVRNPVVLTGDVHAHWAGDLRLDPTDPSTPLVGSELVTSSISSGGDGYDDGSGVHPWFADNPDLRFWTNLRGYVSATLSATAMTVRYRCVAEVLRPGASVATRAEWAIEDGVRGLQEVSSTPLAGRGPDAARAAPADDATIVADTIEAETGVRP